MGKLSKDLYMHEALELRNTYDRVLGLFKHILSPAKSSRDFYPVRTDSSTNTEFDDDFNVKEAEEDIKKLETKRVKLNQAIQVCNFTNTLEYMGSKISIAEALEFRKGLIAEVEDLTEKVKNAAVKEVVHKEERDIERRSKYPYRETYAKYRQKLKDLRGLNNAIHRFNHTAKVDYKDEDDF